MHPLIMEIIAQQRLRDLRLEADRWRVAHSVRARRRAVRGGTIPERTARQTEQTEWTLGEQAVWARGVHGRPAAGA